ncbi:CAP domain-containing protein [Salinirubellus sp. GCM10025818]|uniref:CAP domain-containing protein n=1 Tax=Salinirubellus TaxID=2162630 RepID=UPI0030CB0B19
MVNKVALGILAVIVLTAMTVGGLVGLQLNDDGTPSEATPQPDSTPTPNPAAGTPGGDGGGDDGTPTPTPTPTPAVSASDFDETAIAEGVRTAINVQRADRDMESLRSDEVVNEMARNHSLTMSREGNVTHDAGGLTTMERYRAFDLDTRCRVPDNSYTGIRDGEALETIDRKTLGTNYTSRDGRTRSIENETVAARAVVDSWFTSEEERRKLLLREATVAGVGTVVTEEGELYVTVDLC